MHLAFVSCILLQWHIALVYWIYISFCLHQYIEFDNFGILYLCISSVYIASDTLYHYVRPV